MPRKPSETTAALQQRAAKAEVEAASLRVQVEALNVHVQLLQRELRVAEASPSAPSRIKTARRRTNKQSTVDGVRASSATPISRSPELLRVANGTPQDGSSGSGGPSPEPQLHKPTATRQEKPPLERPPSRAVDSAHADDSPALLRVNSAAFMRVNSNHSLASSDNSEGPAAEPPAKPGAAAGKAVAKLATGSLRSFECPPVREAAAASSSCDVDFDAAVVAGPQPEHAWTSCPGRAFNVRAGPNYSRTGLKLPSLDALYDVVAADAFLCPEEKLPHIARLLELPKEQWLEKYGVPDNLVVSFLVPDYAPALFGFKDNGPGWTLVTVCRLSDAAKQLLRRGELSPALKLWRSVVAAPDDSPLRRRLKCICALANPADIKVDKVTAGLISKYNAKPFLCIKTGVYYPTPHYFGVEVDVHRWGKLALNGWNMVKGHVQHMQIRCGMVIEAQEDEEMPEQMLMATYLSRMNAASCPLVPEHALAAAPYADSMEC